MAEPDVVGANEMYLGGQKSHAGRQRRGGVEVLVPENAEMCCCVADEGGVVGPEMGDVVVCPVT